MRKGASSGDCISFTGSPERSLGSKRKVSFASGYSVPTRSADMKPTYTALLPSLSSLGFVPKWYWIAVSLQTEATVRTSVSCRILFTVQLAILNIYCGWICILVGVLSGALIGLFFHAADWMGGYSAYRRRLTRLGHISFFGMGLLNILFGLSAGPMHLGGVSLSVASWSFVVAAITMPACCFLTAWRKSLRHFFPVPVAASLIAVLCVLVGTRHR